MQERILNLLGLCMQAQEKGHHVNFVCGYYDVYVHHMVKDEHGDYQTASSITVEKDGFCIDEAESYLKGLIEA
jgi:hypothetical protein